MTSQDRGVFCYVVLCHRAPEQVLALVRRLRALSPSCHVLVRHDQPHGFLDEAEVVAAGGTLLHSAVRVQWGDWSMVEATLEALDAARSRGAQWLVLLSGQDWPVRDLDAWEEQVQGKGVDAVVAAQPLEARPGWRGLSSEQFLQARYSHRWRRLPRARVLSGRLPRLRRVLRGAWYRWLVGLQGLVLLNELPRGLGWAVGVRRAGGTPFGPGLLCHKGEQWMVLGPRAHDEVTAFVARRPDVVSHYRQTLVPDESFLQTVLLNAPALVVQRASTSWHAWEGLSPHPLDLRPEHVPQIAAAGSPFARKLASLDDPVRPLLDELAGPGRA